uniref:G-protein coupled receptors family 1 profile domain-containing protein n=1 Tax=Bos mutus grunniens TaxID=30521 RepID=A0A8B9XK02_BOSMU
MSAGNVTPWGSSAAGEEVWVGSGIEVEGAELPTFSVAAEVRMGVTVVLFVSSAGGNLAVLWSVKRPQPSHQLCPSPVRRLFAHLAVADLLVTFVVMPPDATWNITVQWLAGDITCRTLVFLKLVAMYAAAFLPGYWARPPGSRTPPVWTALSWKETSWGSLGTQLSAHLAPGPFTRCVTKGSFKTQWQEIIYNLFIFCCLFLLPLIAMTICYSHIVCSVSTPQTRKGNHAPAGEFALCHSLYNHSRVHHRALRLALLILLTFIFCWTPYYLLGLWYWFSPTMLTEVPPSLSHIFFLFGLLSAPLDPLLYGAFTFGSLRQKYKQMWQQETRRAKETFLCYHLLRTAYIGTE